MGILEGKKALIFGIANNKSIAYGIAKRFKEEGAELGFSYAGEKMEKRVTPISEELGGKFCVSCDVNKDEEIESTFKTVKEEFGTFDILLHSIAFAPADALKGRYIETTRDAYNTALETSAYSLVALCRAAEPLMNKGGSVINLTYYGSEKVIPNYNVMGVAKSALECSTRYLAYDMGENGIRVNSISAGPIKTLAASGIGGFKNILDFIERNSPLRSNVTIDDVAGTAVYLGSELSNKTTGEIIYVDGGYNVMGIGL
ncbi:enoyl-ACP reductase FabI [Limisalsivibrio acetivorans]|uniref:enoyl-ACP reductase FabI n=1 Tax=Limisalsivibrio acetivorans TaxID=1304888 RepID=UPI0003B3CF18|nr:enoyl-ACP reductase [Limisalsivibrio acetivorans]